MQPAGGGYGAREQQLLETSGARKKRAITRMAAGFAVAVAVICVVFSGGNGSVGVSSASSVQAHAPSRGRMSILYSPEMTQASRIAGFDLSTLLQTTSLENSMGNTKLCQKRDKIITLFDRLLARLIDEQGSQSTEFASLSQGSADAYKAYVDAVAAFEDAKQTEKNAKKIRDLAISRASDAMTRYDGAKNEYDTQRAPYDVELTGIEQDIEIIKMILAMLHALHAVPAPGAAPVAALTRQRAQLLETNLAKIQQLAAGIHSPKARALSGKLSFQVLAQHEESNAVVKILMDLLQDILNRQTFINNELKEYKDQVDAADVVKLAAEGDVVTATTSHSAAAVEMNKYSNGQLSELDSASKAAKEEVHLQQSLQTKTGVQFTRERFVIGQIKLKINAYCDETDDLSVDVSHMSCPDPDTMRRYADVCTCMPGYSGPSEGPCVKCLDTEFCFGMSKGTCAADAELSPNQAKCQCKVGFTGKDNTGPCTKCGDNELCPGGSILPNTCPYGKMRNDANTACVTKPGFFKSKTDSGEEPAAPCPAGKACPGGAAGAVLECSANSGPNDSLDDKEDNTACVCNPGYTGPDNAACATCPGGAKCAGGSAVAETCPANQSPSTPVPDLCECKEGFYLVAGACSPCPDGQFCVGGANAPGTCPAHSTPHENGHKCVCNPGSYGDGAGCRACTDAHTCAGGEAAPERCVGLGREVQQGGTVCGCNALFTQPGESSYKDYSQRAFCHRRNYYEAKDAGVHIPTCILDDSKPYIKLWNGYGPVKKWFGKSQMLPAGKWTRENGKCINIGEGQEGLGAEPCKIDNCAWGESNGGNTFNGVTAVSSSGGMWMGYQDSNFGGASTSWERDRNLKQMDDICMEHANARRPNKCTRSFSVNNNLKAFVVKAA